ncbi:MAG: ribonuclease III [Elusimicrobiota bacterium]|jgi:ribonuclease-3|nr:ribonuclease III [Elusimicrobiota bacterium]
MTDISLERLERNIDYYFIEQDFLILALTHTSFASEFSLNMSNERMEFLGDSILGAVVCEFLYRNFPQSNEGILSKLKSTIVSSQHLSLWAREISLGAFLLLGKGEDTKHARNREGLLCDALEALIGAIFLDGGLEVAKKFIMRFLQRDLNIEVTDYKSNLQEICQSKYAQLPKYKLLRATGPDHNKFFEVSVSLKDKVLGVGGGHSKKEAEQNAAQQAIAEIRTKRV